MTFFNEITLSHILFLAVIQKQMKVTRTLNWVETGENPSLEMFVRESGVKLLSSDLTKILNIVKIFMGYDIVSFLHKSQINIINKMWINFNIKNSSKLKNIF